MARKVCFKCLVERPIEEFYKHKRMGDGHLNKCKDCTKKDSSEREQELKKNPEWVDQEKKRSREKYHRLGYKELHKSSYDKKKEYQNKYQSLFPEKVQAQNKSSHLGQKGYHKHHWSYNEIHYKDLIYLLMEDHYFLHRHIQYDQEQKMYRAMKDTESFFKGELLDSKDRHEYYYTQLKEQP
tara:strand:+ start:110 stop:655 length:546 start_codon:yes stop_codon:yes gene_type:complete